MLNCKFSEFLPPFTVPSFLQNVYKDDLNWLRGIGCYVWDTPQILHAKKAYDLQSQVSQSSRRTSSLWVREIHAALSGGDSQAVSVPGRGTVLTVPDVREPKAPCPMKALLVACSGAGPSQFESLLWFKVLDVYNRKISRRCFLVNYF